MFLRFHGNNGGLPALFCPFLFVFQPLRGPRRGGVSQNCFLPLFYCHVLRPLFCSIMCSTMDDPTVWHRCSCHPLPGQPEPLLLLPLWSPSPCRGCHCISRSSVLLHPLLRRSNAFLAAGTELGRSSGQRFVSPTPFGGRTSSSPYHSHADSPRPLRFFSL